MSNEAVRGIGMDQYGFIWMGTNFGLNRFDGINIRTWTNDPSDSTSLASNFVRSMHGDRSGRIWIGGDPGFCQYNYAANNFIRYQNVRFNMIDIDQDLAGNIWIATNRGLKLVDTIKRSLVDMTYPADTLINRLFGKSSRDVHCDANGKVYVATDEGIIQYDPQTKNAIHIGMSTHGHLLPNEDISAVTTDPAGNIWVVTQATGEVLVRISNDFKTAKRFEYLRRPGNASTPNSIIKLYTDRKGRMWIASSYWGLTRFDNVTQKFVRHINDPMLPHSISSAHITTILLDKHGILWAGSEGFGVNYFNPDHDIFHVIQRNPYLDKKIADEWTRAFMEDEKQNLWIATAKGISVIDKTENIVLDFLNSDSAKPELAALSVRSIMRDTDGSVWIGTAAGLNRYYPATGKMDSYTERDGIAPAFTWFIEKTKDGRVLVGTNRGLYEYRPAADTFYFYANHPAFKDFKVGLRCFKEDSKGRWWIGSFNSGIMVFDPVTQTALRVISRTGDSTGLSSNFTHAIIEDDAGVMWISTRYQLNAYNFETKKAEYFSTADGLPNNWIASIVFDSVGRLWIGTGKGLSVMSKDRKIIKTFGLQDGLVTTQFTDQPGFKRKDGNFVFPTTKGLLVINPGAFNWKDELPDPFVVSMKLSGKEWKSDLNLEELATVSLGANDNFFSIELMGVQFYNPSQVWYAYKLEGFNSDWVYTQERTVNFTNVPGGKYTFRYKASLNSKDWDVKEKTLVVEIDTEYYKTWWFRVLIGFLLAGTLFAIYRYRIHQKEKMLELETKAQALEKEKVLVMYESLKQQLNPHFLFNSLTSLSGLISTDQKMAGNFLDQMSKMYRYILTNRDSETVRLRDELQFVQLYINMQKTRFSKGLEVIIKTDPSKGDNKIAPVTIQNLVENAIKHNVIDSESPLVIEIFTEQNYLVVMNNLQRKNMVETSNRQGLTNLKSLYKYLSRSPLVIEETAKHFLIKIPLLPS
ncbi:MAG: histidine kinase [Chitinophagaceae bacterium]|nr:histidine kinase [Chitinophagaceae bacterium]